MHTSSPAWKTYAKDIHPGDRLRGNCVCAQHAVGADWRGRWHCVSVQGGRHDCAADTPRLVHLHGPGSDVLGGGSDGGEIRGAHAVRRDLFGTQPRRGYALTHGVLEWISTCFPPPYSCPLLARFDRSQVRPGHPPSLSSARRSSPCRLRRRETTQERPLTKGRPAFKRAAGTRPRFKTGGEPVERIRSGSSPTAF